MATLSLASAPAPTASLALLTGGRALPAGRRGCLGFSKPSVRAPSPLLHTSFVASSLSLSFPSSSVSGISLGVDFAFSFPGRERRRGLVVRAGKAALCMTKRSRSRKSLARTHGFRRRMRTTTGRAVLKRRRSKGRKVLCTKSNPNNGKRG